MIWSVSNKGFKLCSVGSLFGKKMESKKGKHVLNSLDSAVLDNLIGFVSIQLACRLYNEHVITFQALNHDHVQVIPFLNTIVSKAALDAKTATQTAIVSGAGSGHEPFAHALVGKGGIAASIAGQVFASPSTGQVLQCLRLLSKFSKEILIVVNNYTGDRLNFGLAAERLKVKEGIACKLFCFGDDVSFDLSKISKTGRRGLAGATLLIKCLSSLSEKGYSLDHLYDSAVELTSRIATMSASLSSCDIPGSGTSFTLTDQEMEIGLGIHGESGVMRTERLLSSQELVSLLLDFVMNEAKSPIACRLKETSPRIALLVNNIGGLSNFDLNIVCKDAVQECRSRGLVVERILTGTFVSSFSMNGVSLTVMLVDDDVLDMLDAPSQCPALSSNRFRRVNTDPILVLEKEVKDKSVWIPIPGLTQESFRKVLVTASEALISVEGVLNQLDKQGGDGDCGLTCRKGAEALKKLLSESDSCPSFLEIGDLCSNEMGGTSGAIYSLLMTSIHDSVVKDRNSNESNTDINGVIKFWSRALERSLETVTLYSWATEGDRTMLDTLFSVLKLLKTLSSTSNDSTKVIWEKIASEAESGCRATSLMTSNAGRSLYANQDLTRGNQDPGAVGVLTWIQAVSRLFV